MPEWYWACGCFISKEISMAILGRVGLTLLLAAALMGVSGLQAVGNPSVRVGASCLNDDDDDDDDDKHVALMDDDDDDDDDKHVA